MLIFLNYVAFFPRHFSDRFIILPPKETTSSTIEEELRPRPASLRQAPKRRFSTYVPSTNDMNQQPSTSSTLQPPISLRFKRISDPIEDSQKMPPPKLNKITIKKTIPPSTTPTTSMPIVTPIENVNLSQMGLIYVCYHCQHQADNFESIQAHWLKVHKKGEDPTTKRFFYRISKLVRCVYCPIGTDQNLTYQTIRKHINDQHKNNPHVYAMHKSNVTNAQSMECGQCGKVLTSIAALQTHFEIEHRAQQKLSATLLAEPLPMINDSILNALQQQGDQGTFKCSYCGCFFSCRYDYDQHHREQHPILAQKYELNGKDIIKYGCHICSQTKTDELTAIEHLRAHYPIFYQCQYCTARFKYLSLIVPHHNSIHTDTQVKFKMICQQDHFIATMHLTLTFSNGLTLMWGDVINTKCGGADRLRKLINNLIETQNQQQLSEYNEQIKSKDSTAASTADGARGLMSGAGTMPGKIGHRRQTHL